MKTHTFKITNKATFIWFIIFIIIGIIFAHLSSDKFDWDIFQYYFMIGISPNLFIFGFGEKIEQ